MIRAKLFAPEIYRGHTITVAFMGPDFLAFVNEAEMPNFYISPQAAVSGGQRYVNDIEKTKEKRG